MKRLVKTLAATFAVIAASAGSAFAAGPVQSGTQSSSTSQGALAASSATQVEPSNQNISVRVLSPGNDGAVSQSNTASSTADASNTAATTQSTSQTQASGCGCAIKSGKLDDVLGAAMQAANDPASTQAQAPAATGPTQANDAGSTGTSSNTAPTSQATTQASPAASGGSGVQSSQQDASTDQKAIAASSATQVAPSNSNISVRVLSEGDNGAVSQSNTASSSADASNSAATTQGSSQTGGGSGVQSSTQSADTTQGSLAKSSATQIAPSNSNISVRVLSPGNGGSVHQSNKVESSANAENSAPVTQTSTQGQAGSSCGCKSGSPAVQSIGQDSSVEQGAVAASSATQVHPSNVNTPVRVGSEGNDGSVRQSNEASSEADASNSAPVSQTGTQQQAASSCGCSSGPAVQELGQSSEVGQLGIARSSSKQIGASNENGPIRIASDGNGGAVSQSNEAESSADASNTAPVRQTGTQQQAGSGVQAALQESFVGQAALAASSATQIHPSNANTPVRVLSPGNDGRVRQSNEAESSANAENNAPVSQTGTQQRAAGSCRCSSGPAVQALGQSSEVEQGALAASSAKQIGASNVSDPVRVASDGNDGSLWQSNETSSEANASKSAPVSQTGTQQQAAGSSCGCSSGPAVQALGQSSSVGQLGIALSSAWQVGASNESGPIRIASDGNGGHVSQSNETESSADTSNSAPVSQTGTQQQAGRGVQALGQESEIGQAALAGSAVFQLPGESRCGCGSSFGNSAGPVRVYSDGNDGSLRQSNEASSSADASNYAAPTQQGTQTQASPSCSCGGLGVQALGQVSTIDQIAAALSAAKQVGASNASGPVRIWSTGGGGRTRQSNDASSDSTGANVARTLQAGRQMAV